MYVVPVPVPPMSGVMHPEVYQPNGDLGSYDSCNKKVMAVFDEFLALISKPFKFHPSEEVNKRSPEKEYYSSRVYEIINYYHTYCKLCSQHFYSRSVMNDINSYFQRHLNSSFHKACKASKFFPDNQPIFKWENWLVSGYCNVCQMKGIHAFVIHSELSSKDLLKIHNCNWSHQERHYNEKFLEKVQVLRLFGSLNIFKKKFIKSTFEKEKDESICVLCYSYFLGSGDKVSHHLVSPKHFGKFSSFIWETFQFSLNDLLNGYNLETVIRWALFGNYKTPMFVVERVDDYQACMDLSYNDTDVYETQQYCGFSPLFMNEILKIQNSDFVTSTFCLLCNEQIKDSSHMSSEKHTQKANDLHQFYETEEYTIYLNNRERRLRGHEQKIKMFRKLKREVLDYGLQIGVPWSPEVENKLSKFNDDIRMGVAPGDHSLGEESDADDSGQVASIVLKPNKVFQLMTKKLERVNSMFTQVGRSFIMCEVCDSYLSVDAQGQHMSDNAHHQHVEKWTAIIYNFKSLKFLEPIQTFQFSLGCFICGETFHEDELVDHLKKSDHLDNFKIYNNLDFPISISECFQFDSNAFGSCICKKCDSQVNTKGWISLDDILKSIKMHYPCHEINNDARLARDLYSLSLTTKKKNEVVHSGNASSDVLIFCFVCGLPFKETVSKIHCPSCAKIQIPNFDYIRSILESIMSIFETKIVEYVMDSSANFINEMNSQQKQIKASGENEEKDSDKNSTPVQSDTPSKESGETETDKKTEETNAPKTSKAVVQISAEVTYSNKNSDEGEREQVETEILLIMGLPDVKEKCHKIYLLFKDFGQIRYLFCKNSTGILQFEDRGAALTVSKSGPHFLDGSKLKLVCITRKITKQLCRQVFELQVPKLWSITPLNSHVYFVLGNVPALHNFVWQLVNQSDFSNMSGHERRREKIVCDVILGVIRKNFPHSRCYMFGSRLSGLNISNSDMDVFLDCGEMYEGCRNTGYVFEKKILLSVSEALRVQPDCKDITVVQRARVPIVSFTHRPTNLRCDISFKNGLGVQNTLLIKHLISLDWRVKPLILFLKYWTFVNELHGPPFFSSYAIAMLVIFFLEQGPFPILPTIEQLQDDFVGKRLTIGGWDCSFSNEKIYSKNADPLPILFLHFFEFYANFNYEEYVIAPLTGKPLPRKQLENPASLPMPFKRHAHNIPNKNFINNEIPICVWDPFDLSHILTKNFPKHDFLVFLHLCNLSAYYLKKAMGMA